MKLTLYLAEYTDDWRASRRQARLAIPVPQNKDGTDCFKPERAGKERPMNTLLEQIEQGVSRPTPHVTARRTPSAAGEQIRDLCQRLERLRRTRETRSILITSAVPREGKTAVAVDLAIALAKHWPRALLVDGDLHKAGVAGSLGLSPLLPGFAEGLEHDRDLGGSVRFVEPLNIYWLPAGCPSSDEPERVLHNVCLRNRLRELHHEFDWVIVDSPSIQSAETRLLSYATDVVVMVVKAGSTPRDQVRDSIGSLEGAFLAGVISNQENKASRDWGRSYSYGSLAFGIT
jgi:Mrp family chromosome partitioning ATPase